MQPWLTPFPIWNQSVVRCPVLTVASWPAYRSLKRQIMWSGVPLQNFPQLIVIHTVKAFGIINKAEIGVVLELFCFFHDAVRVALWSLGLFKWVTSSHQVAKVLEFQLQHQSFQWTPRTEKVIFIPIPKKSNTKECTNYHTIALISHTGKVMLKILQAMLQ